MKKSVVKTIDSFKDDIIACGDYILQNPELGFKEKKTSEYIKKEFKKLSIPYEENLAITGVKGKLKGKKSGINVCVIGEMDAVKCLENKFSDNETGAAHACGHNAQIAMMLGVAYGLKESGVMDFLCGDVTFMAVPAEEFVEIEYREQLKKKGKIGYLSGKQELIRIGAFNDIDIAIMIHSEAGTPEPNIFLNGSSLGFIAKNIEFYGKSAHAARPYEGINALNAASLSLMAIHANREVFRDEDKIRIHPIITNGGDLVNVVPSKVTMETYVRGANMPAIINAAQKVDNAINGSCISIGATCKITDIQGYMPLLQDEYLSEVFEKNALDFVNKENIFHNIDMTGSTDMGDLSNIIPCIQPTMGGFLGSAHGADFEISSKETAYITTSKILATTIIDLLSDDGKIGKEIIENYKKKKKKEK
ncbi:MAG: amidohydrolase [Oscillospiraceae bacterium]